MPCVIIVASELAASISELFGLNFGRINKAKHRGFRYGSRCFSWCYKKGLRKKREGYIASQKSVIALLLSLSSQKVVGKLHSLIVCCANFLIFYIPPGTAW